ncbi:hypothetical protein G9464_09110 [Halostella sp. JP-L12]|uniref:amidase family protein n=1 Tax=Halostella TaxID=1843185 RepID=UPI000EF817A2|nr:MULTISPECIES: amidase family protein [Halostella]NHN47754.1 hypothetical protein [Halostella sp. JP-L12]
MTNSEPAAAVREAAATYGIDLDEAGVEAYAAELTNTEALVGDIEPDLPEAEPAADVRKGDDPHDAFLYRFETDPAEDGPLSGVTTAVKDNMAVAGVPMTCGSAAVEFTPSYHATVVSRLLDAGAEVVGTTNMDEFAYFTSGETCAHGPIRNPRVDGATPGGSSSGSGAAVAAGEVDVALGSDTGGSIRIPASFCGVIGLKPTHGTVSRFGFADLAPSLDHVGPLADSVANAARALEAIGGADSRDPSMRGRAPRSGLVDAADGDASDLSVGVIEAAMAGADDPVSERVNATVDALADAGATVDRVSFDGFAQLPILVTTIVATEFTSLVDNNGVVHGSGTGYSEAWRAAVAEMDADAVGDNVRDWLVLGRALAERTEGEPYVAARNAARRFTGAVEDALGERDALVLPTTPMTAPDFGEIDDDESLLRTIAHTGPFNLTGHPAISVPCGDVDGRPVGFQAVAGYDDEATAVRVGAAVEER